MNPSGAGNGDEDAMWKGRRALSVASHGLLEIGSHMCSPQRPRNGGNADQTPADNMGEVSLVRATQCMGSKSAASLCNNNNQRYARTHTQVSLGVYKTAEHRGGKTEEGDRRR